MFAHDLRDNYPSDAAINVHQANYSHAEAMLAKSDWAFRAREYRRVAIRRTAYYAVFMLAVAVLFMLIAVNITRGAERSRYYSRWHGDPARHGTRTERGVNPAYYPQDLRRFYFPYCP